MNKFTIEQGSVSCGISPFPSQAPRSYSKAYCPIRLFITFNGIFMGPGYGGGIWNEKGNGEIKC